MPKQPLIVGNPVLVVVDMQECGDMPAELVGIEHMAGYDGRIARAQRLIAAARAASIPIVFFQEVHRANGIVFGRVLDGGLVVRLGEVVDEDEVIARVLK